MDIFWNYTFFIEYCYCFSGTTHDIITFLICINTQKRNISKLKKDIPKRKTPFFSVLSVSFEVAGWVKDVGGWVNEHRRCEPLGGSGGMPPQKILKSRHSEMAFPAFSNTYFSLKWQCKKCNTGAKSVTPVQITHRNSGLID